jgi:hypothetical protein
MTDTQEIVGKVGRIKMSKHKVKLTYSPPSAIISRKYEQLKVLRSEQRRLKESAKGELMAFLIARGRRETT